MKPVTAREVALAAQDFRVSLPDHASIYRGTSTRSASGGTVNAYPATPSFTTAARIAPMGDEIERFYSDRLGGKQGWTGTFPPAYEPALRDRVVVHGRTYEVIGSNLGKTIDVVRRVPLKEVT